MHGGAAALLPAPPAAPALPCTTAPAHQPALANGRARGCWQNGVESFKSTDYESAADAFSAAHSVAPGLPIPPYNIACCHARLNAPAVAVSWLRTAFALQRALDEGVGVAAEEQARQAGTAAPLASIGIMEVMDDPDFDGLKEYPGFESLLREETARPSPAKEKKTTARAGWKKVKVVGKREKVKKQVRLLPSRLPPSATAVSPPKSLEFL